MADGAGVTTFGVRELLDELRAIIDAAAPTPIWVQGEIRGLTRSRPGHVYFDLVEPGSDARRPEVVLPVALFASDRRQVDKCLADADAGELSEGAHVRIQGKIGLYTARSQVQLVMRSIDPVFTLGQIELARRALLDSLATEGLLTRNSSLEVPTMVRRVALVTSASSAACADALHELESWAIGWDVVLVDTQVQGMGAESMIAAAIARAVSEGVELILLVRGGGSRSDLAPFDSERVARAIALCAVPVWTGIGHEIDRSVADEVAARSHKTPTACAAAVADMVRAQLDLAHDLWSGIERRCTEVVSRGSAALQRCAHRLESSTGHHLRSEQSRLSRIASELPRSASHRVARAEMLHSMLDSRIRGSDPLTLVQKGWSITTLPDGAVLRSVQDAPVGTVLRTRVGDGVVVSTVEEAGT